MSDLFEFLQDSYPEFTQCLDDHGYLDSLMKRKNLTLLIPNSYMTEFLEKCANDDELSDNTIKALILNVKLNQAKDWDSVRDQITNKLNQKVDVKAITKSSIVLANDVVLKPVKCDNENLSIWSIEKGTMSLNGQKMKIGKPVVKKQEDDSPLRANLARDLETKYDRGKTNTFLNFMSVLMRIIKDEDKSLYNVLTFILDPNPIVSFYLLVEPYKNSGSFIIPTYILKKVSSKLPNSLRSWKSNFSTPSNVEDMQSIIDDLSEDIQSDVGSKGQLEKIKLAYNDFSEGNGIFPKLPSDVQKFYKQNIGIKLWQDGARHLIRKAFDGDSIDRDNVIAEMFSQYSTGNTIVTDPRFYKKSGTTAVYDGLAGEFIHSNLLMYIPRAPIVDGDDIISKTWEELESQSGEYTAMDDNIVRQLREIQENEPGRFEKIMKEFGMVGGKSN